MEHFQPLSCSAVLIAVVALTFSLAKEQRNPLYCTRTYMLCQNFSPTCHSDCMRPGVIPGLGNDVYGSPNLWSSQLI